MTTITTDTASMSDTYRSLRETTQHLAAPLSCEDCQAQATACASPTKWHLAHTTWFFETFVLRPFMAGYTPWHEQFSYLFNSYYNSIGQRIERPKRGLMTRPTLDEVKGYRTHVDENVQALLSSSSDQMLRDQVNPRLELGLHHEQQHQELILTDLKLLFWHNPLLPRYRDGGVAQGESAAAIRWNQMESGLTRIGHDDADAFAYDNEMPAHQRYLDSFRIASRPVTCGEFVQFIDDGGYERSDQWLSDGWETVEREQWTAPLYWHRSNGDWQIFTLSGPRPLSHGEPVCHVSYFEADAYARWAGTRLPREDEWESAAGSCSVKGNLLESQRYHPRAAPVDADGQSPDAMFGDVWEWTQSQYTAYPGYRAPDGALGEYNGKFMCNQFVLRGGSCATPASHIRKTYRNFFPPDARWQFTGIRLAQDA